jgi:hypothetical protein
LLESHAASGAAAPTLSTAGALDRGVSYRVTVTGTYSPWSSLRMAVETEPGWLVCGAPESRPTFPSPGIRNGRSAADAEFRFARPERGTTCGSNALPEHRRTVRFSVDGGLTYTSVAPDGGVPASADPYHVYSYRLTGQGLPLVVEFIDSNYADNAGQLRVTVEAM